MIGTLLLVTTGLLSSARALESPSADETYSAYEGEELPQEPAKPWLRHVFESDVADHRWGLGVSLGAPQVVRLHGLYKRAPRLHYVMEGEWLPVPFGTSATLSMIGLDLGVRYTIHDSGWYLAGGLGFWSVAYRNSGQSFQGVTGLSASLQAIYLNPGLGWLWHQREGFTIGSEVGLQMPLYAWGEIGTTGASSSYTTSLTDASREVLAHYGFLILPRVTLIRLCWILP